RTAFDTTLNRAVDVPSRGVVPARARRGGNMPEASQAGVQDTGAVPMDAIAALIEARLAPEDAREATEFVKAYYAAGLDELPAGGPRRLAGAALGHLAFARRRAPGETLVDVFNPDI